MTSPLFIVFASRDRSHWHRLFFHSFGTITLFYSMGKENLGITYKLLGLMHSYSFHTTGTGSISVHLFYRDILLSSHLSWAWSLILWRYLSKCHMMSRALRILRLYKTSVPHDLVKIYPLQISPSRVVMMQEILEGQQFHFMCKARWRF